MTKFNNELFDDTCWVYIQQHTDNSFIIGITYDEEFRQKESNAGNKIQYWRKFDDTLSAAAHRKTLVKLPGEKIKEIISPLERG